MEPPVFERSGYRFKLVNIECLPHSTHYNILMDLDTPIEDLLPYLAASLPSCTYVHGTGVVQFMDRGHIVAIYPDRLTITDVPGPAEAETICAECFSLIERVRRDRSRITPVMRRRSALSVLDIYRHLPRTNCGQCHLSTCFALAAAVFRRENPITVCPPVQGAPDKFGELIDLLQANGYPTP